MHNNFEQLRMIMFQMYENQFHPHNSVILTIKRYLTYIYGYSNDMDAENFKMKINHCKEILETCNVVMPG